MSEPIKSQKISLLFDEAWGTMLFVAVRFAPWNSKCSASVTSIICKKKKKRRSRGKTVKRNTVVSHQSQLEENP